MHGLSGERILLAWERGLACREPWRALALLALALPEHNTAELANLPLAERNAMLLQLRTATFGKSIEGFAMCPECGVAMEFAVNADDLYRDVRALPEDTWLDGEKEMHMRPANSGDLAAAMDESSEDSARALLLSLTMGLKETTAELRAEWVERFDRLNAAAEIRCVLPCTACGARAVLDFDIAGFLWREVVTSARRLLGEIHRLASAYGWSEATIAAMSATRRSAYLEMLNS